MWGKIKVIFHIYICDVSSTIYLKGIYLFKRHLLHWWIDHICDSISWLLYSTEQYDYPYMETTLSLLLQLYYESWCHVVKSSKCALIPYCFSIFSVFHFDNFYTSKFLKSKSLLGFWFEFHRLYKSIWGELES